MWTMSRGLRRVRQIISGRRKRQLEEANLLLARANAQLLQADREKTAFLSMVAHELRTPMTSIQGFTALLIADPNLNSTEREYVECIARNAETLSRLVTQLFEFSRIGRGEVSVVIEPVSLSSLTADVVKELAAVAGDHHVLLEVQSDVTVRADRDAVTRILSNLFANAVKFSPPGTEIGITVDAAGGMGVLSVLDEGPGVSESDRERVFELFYRGSGAGEQASGLGIGLAVVRELTERMGGSVAAENRREGGASFSVRLPLDLPAPQGSLPS